MTTSLITTTSTDLTKTKVPALPFAPVEYTQKYQDDLTNILRLYFNTIDNLAGQLALSTAGSGFYIPYGSWHDTTTQAAAANTITLITMNAVDYESGVTLVSGSKMTAATAGVYSMQFSLQGVNTSSQTDNITVWVRINGADVTNSAGITGIPPKHGSINGSLIFGWDQLLSLNAGDYIQLYWTTDNGSSSLTTYPIGVAPVHPASPSIAITISFVSALPA